MSEQQDVWCSRCWGDHYTNDCPHKQAAEEENRLFELEEAEEEKKRALESEAEIALLTAHLNRKNTEMAEMLTEANEADAEIARLEQQIAPYYKRAWETWNMTNPDSTQWEELDEGDRSRWIRAIEELRKESR